MILFNFQNLPDLHLNDMSLICRTFSLATLRNIFPDATSWKAATSSNPHVGHGGGTDSNQHASPYVQLYIGKYSIYISILYLMQPFKKDADKYQVTN